MPNIILSGYSGSLPSKVLLGPSVLYIDSATPWAASQGGININLPEEYENLPVDGKTVPIAGLDRNMGGEPSFEGTFIEMDATRALELMPGGTTSTSGGITTITPKLRGDFLSLSDYKQNVRVAFRMGGSGIFLVEFNIGLLKVASIGSDGTNGNASYKVSFVNRQPSDAASLGVAGYTLKLAPDLATVVAADP